VGRVPLGVDEIGEPATVSLPERNLLMRGEPAAGNSAALSLVLAAAELDASVKPWLLLRAALVSPLRVPIAAGNAARRPAPPGEGALVAPRTHLKLGLRERRRRTAVHVDAPARSTNTRAASSIGEGPPALAGKEG
jgi:hypothetical protein